MAQKFLDNQTGLPTLWGLIKTKFVAKESGKTLTSNDFTTPYKTKLDTLDTTISSAIPNGFATIASDNGSITAATKTDTITIKGGDNVTTKVTSGNNVEISAIDTKYEKASSTKDGLMSKEDKIALDGLQVTGGQANVIEVVKVNGTALTVTDKAVDVTVPTNTSQLTNGAGFQTAAQVNTTISGKGFQTAAQVESIVTSKGYQTSSQVESAITAKGYMNSTAVNSAIESAVSSVYKVKGSVNDAKSLPSSSKTGDVYNIKAASTYGPAGMNVVWNGTEWDALGSSITIEAMTASEIQAICV